MQFAFGGSYEVDNPDSIVNQLGMTGIPFFNMYNGCATAASVLTQATNTIRLGEYDIGMAIGMDKHMPGAFNADPTLYSLPSWYGEAGMFLTPKYFAEKIQRYMHDFDITPTTLARVAAKNFHNGSLNENAFRRTPMSVEAILESRIVNDPLTQYMFCAPDEGAAAIVLCRADRAHEFTDTPIYLHASEVRTRRIGAFEVHSPSIPLERVPGPDRRRVDAPRTRRPASDRRTSTSSSCRTPTPAPRCTTWPRTASAPMATRSGCSPTGRPTSTARCRSTPTAASSPTANRSARPGLRQIHELVKQLRGQAGDRQVPGNPKVGYAQLYGAPGTAGVSIISR